MATSRALDLIREVADKCACHEHGISTAAGTTSLTAANYPFKSARTNESSKKYEGDEIYLALTQPSTTLSSAVTAAATSISVADGSSWPSGATTPFIVGVDQEFIRVTRSSNTLTVVSNGRGLLETRPAAHVSGATIYGPATAYNPEQIAAYVASTGVFTPGNAWSIDPGEVIPFDIFTRGVSYWDVVRALNQALRELKDDSYFPLSNMLDGITDGDMRAIGTESWTAGGTATLSKVTTTRVRLGPQALRVLASTANDYAQSVSIPTNPDDAQTWYVAAAVICDNTAAATATLRAYDVTNSAQIAAESWSDRKAGIIDFTFAIPTTCRLVAFQLESDTATTDATWSYIMAYPIGGREIWLPSWLTNPSYFRDMVSAQSGTNRIDNPIFNPVPGHLMHDPSNPNGQVRFHFAEPIQPKPYWIHAVRPHDPLVADAQTTYADRDLVVACAATKLCEMQLSKPASEHTNFWRIRRREVLAEYVDLSRRVLPGPAVTVGYERAW